MLGIPSQELLCREEAALSVPFVPFDFFFSVYLVDSGFRLHVSSLINGLYLHCSGSYCVDDEGFNMMTAIVLFLSWK